MSCFLFNFASNISKIPQLNFPWKLSGNLPDIFRPFATLSAPLHINVKACAYQVGQNRFFPFWTCFVNMKRLLGRRPYLMHFRSSASVCISSSKDPDVLLSFANCGRNVLLMFTCRDHSRFLISSNETEIIMGLWCACKQVFMNFIFCLLM